MDKEFANVPSHTVEALDRYWHYGFMPGSFLGLLLCGDIYNAIGRADHSNKFALGSIVEYIVRKAPRGSYGSEALVQDWINQGEMFQQYQKQRVVEILSN
jgi:hypothetical protein